MKLTNLNIGQRIVTTLPILTLENQGYYNSSKTWNLRHKTMDDKLMEIPNIIVINKITHFYTPKLFVEKFGCY